MSLWPLENPLPMGLVFFAYLLGAIPFGLIIARMFGVSDLRKSGSGNIGATNVYRLAGWKAALLVFFFDIGKGLLPVFLAGRVSQSFFSQELYGVVCGGAAVLGHVFPIYLKFKGGKGVNTALGALIILMPREIVVALGVFFLTVLITRYVSLGSVLGAVAVLCVTLVEKYILKVPVPFTFVVVSATLCILIITTHRKNITRLMKGTENRISLGGSKQEANRSV